MKYDINFGIFRLLLGPGANGANVGAGRDNGDNVRGIPVDLGGLGPGCGMWPGLPRCWPHLLGIVTPRHKSRDLVTSISL